MHYSDFSQSFICSTGKPFIRRGMDTGLCSKHVMLRHLFTTWHATRNDFILIIVGQILRQSMWSSTRSSRETCDLIKWLKNRLTHFKEDIIFITWSNWQFLRNEIKKRERERERIHMFKLNIEEISSFFPLHLLKAWHTYIKLSQWSILFYVN